MLVTLSLVPGSQGQIRAGFEGGRFVPMATLTFRREYGLWHNIVRPDFGDAVASTGHKPGWKLACACPLPSTGLSGEEWLQDGWLSALLLPGWALASDRTRTGFF